MKQSWQKIERIKSLVNLALANDLTQLSTAIEDVHTVSLQISNVGSELAAIQLRQLDEDRVRIEDWLCSLDFRARQQEIFRGAQEGTRQWLFDSPQFQEWMASDEQNLWRPGIPGARKTVTSSIIVNHLRLRFLSCNIAVASLFCDYRDVREQNADTFMSSLLKQSSQERPVISESLRKLHDKYVQRSNNDIFTSRPSFAELSQAFEEEISTFDAVYIILDALDETSENNTIRTEFLSQLESLPIHILVTSRYSRTLECRFQKARRLEIQATAKDVGAYVRARLPSEPLLTRHCEADSNLKGAIVAHIIAKSRGM